MRRIGFKNALGEAAPPSLRDFLGALLPVLRRALPGYLAENAVKVGERLKADFIRESLMARGIAPAPLDGAPREIIGLGLEVEHAGHRWQLGRPSWIGVESQAETVFTCDGNPLAEFRFMENVRTDARAALSEFRARGMNVVILSGDRQEKVTRLASALDLPTAHARGELTPEEKAAWLRQHDGAHTLMIGEGANDSLAFNEALCTGTPVIDRGLLEKKADFYFLGRSLSGLRALLSTAEARFRAGRRVIAFTLLYNAVAVALSAAGWMSPLAAAILMPLSSLITIGLVLFTLRAVPQKEQRRGGR